MNKEGLAVFLLSNLLIFSASGQEVARAFERTEQREDCDHYNRLKQPFFGDLHVHTSYSHDAYVSNQRNDPWDAYRYAKGEQILQPDSEGEQTVVSQISRPLDFAAVTDHAEYLGELNLCTRDSSRFAYWMPQCVMNRADNPGTGRRTDFHIRLARRNSIVHGSRRSSINE